MAEEELAGEARYPDGDRVVVLTALWQEKVLQDHPELGPHFTDVLRAISEPDHVTRDPIFGGAAPPLPPQRRSQPLAARDPKL